MRIEFVTDTFSPDINGVAMTLGRLVEGLRERGHLVHVWHTAERKGELGETALPSVPLPGYKEVRVGLPGRLKLLRRWQKKSPDVVYVATESLMGLSAIKAAAMLKIPVAVGFHTNFDEYLEQYKLAPLKPVTMNYLKKVHNRADCTFAPSKEVVAKLKKEGFKEVFLLGRGVDIDQFHPQHRDGGLRKQWGVGESDPVVLMVGRLAPEKNLELGVRAYREIQKSYPGAKCVLVGDGPVREGLAGDYPDLIFMGAQLGSDLARSYASADVLLFPSETETFGNVLLEGMASGLSTVSYDYAASAKHIKQEVNGRKAPFSDEHEFIRQSVLATDEPLGSELRREAHRAVLEMGWGQVVGSFEERIKKMSETRMNTRTISRQKPTVMEFRSVFISDVHLGTSESRVKEVLDFLKYSRFEKLFLNGDIIDGWALKRGDTWKKSHSKFVRYIFKLMEQDDVEVIYLRGNHDDVLDRFLPMEFGSMKLVKEYVYQAFNGKKYFVVHGDGFDDFSKEHKWVAGAGSFAYEQLIKVNRLYNGYRSWRGKGDFSMSQAMKSKVKSAASFVDRYQEQLQKLARSRGCEGIICGHIHTPADEMLDGVHYLNSGDWVESLSAVVENLDGSFEVLYYEDFLQRIYSDPMAQERAEEGKMAEIDKIVSLSEVDQGAS